MMTMDIAYFKNFACNTALPVRSTVQRQAVIIVFYTPIENWISHHIM